ncbi:hypothetical protein GMOD_00007950 [Pyrenophora seminiperda CCB06]|uniref:Uncharacterized protein n=1 Tax=Pyrenophora seminiperda CCB06 TaxID=1302712 RepID=A0A3M7MG75_9PLEO|nr:hypothetical protein GMOD_00007950 [Pyrenophora seminiperda CCB06]
MVAAVLKFSSSADGAVSSYFSPDAGRLDLLDVLNWHEAYGEYEWPDFISAILGYDFTRAMVFRCVLVSDVFVALEKTGMVMIVSQEALGVLGTPSSSGKRAGEQRKQVAIFRSGNSWVVGGRMTERKGRRKRTDSEATILASDNLEDYGESFLANMIDILIVKLKSPQSPYKDTIGSIDAQDVGSHFVEVMYNVLVAKWEEARGHSGSDDIFEEDQVPKMANPSFGESSFRANMDDTAYCALCHIFRFLTE